MTLNKKELAGDDIRQLYHSEFVEDDNGDENTSDSDNVKANPDDSDSNEKIKSGAITGHVVVQCGWYEVIMSKAPWYF